jgi:hypothetical protein
MGDRVVLCVNPWSVKLWFMISYQFLIIHSHLMSVRIILI